MAAASVIIICWRHSPLYWTLRNREYYEVEGLIRSVSSGAIAPVKGSYIVEMLENGERIMPRQDTHHRAFWRSSELQAIFNALRAKFGTTEATRRFCKLFVAFSYRWLSITEPDPDMFHLTRVGEAAKLYIKSQSKSMGIKQLVFAPLGIENVDFALLWDWTSLFQARSRKSGHRTAKQSMLYRKGISYASIWYGHAHTVTWMNTAMPATVSPTHVKYTASGWCWAESRVSATLKPHGQLVDLGSVDVG
uniref:Uncharacterized protein n=1 Tax=Haptolina brevifila TaxID=156173 RepID=A0A7S2GTQ4_9EUKA